MKDTNLESSKRQSMFDKVQLTRPKLIKVKKNQIDMTTGFLYSMGCSIIHLSLLITLFIIDKPNLN